MVRRQELVSESIFDCDSLLGREGETTIEEVDGGCVCVGIENVEGASLLEGQCSEVIARSVGGDLVAARTMKGHLSAEHTIDAQVFEAGRTAVRRYQSQLRDTKTGDAQHIEDERKLMVVVPTGEERLARQHLGEDTADRPDVNRFLFDRRRDHRLEKSGRRTVYSLKVSMISGARYHLVATYSVMKPVASTSPSTAERARPKSQILRSQLALRRRLLGFKSR